MNKRINKQTNGQNNLTKGSDGSLTRTSVVQPPFLEHVRVCVCVCVCVALGKLRKSYMGQFGKIGEAEQTWPCVYNSAPPHVCKPPVSQDLEAERACKGLRTGPIENSSRPRTLLQKHQKGKLGLRFCTFSFALRSRLLRTFRGFTYESSELALFTCWLSRARPTTRGDICFGLRSYHTALCGLSARRR